MNQILKKKDQERKSNCNFLAFPEKELTGEEREMGKLKQGLSEPPG